LRIDPIDDSESRGFRGFCIASEDLVAQNPVMGLWTSCTRLKTQEIKFHWFYWLWKWSA